jgi:hypothetical protein
MRLGFAWFLLIVASVRCLTGCSLQEAAAAPGEPAAPSSPRDREIAREQRELDRRRQQQQDAVLSDLLRLREGRATGANESAGDDPPTAARPKLLIFGGASHEVYLGCLCDEKNPESVFNLAGEFGSEYSAASLRNKLAPYGSSHADTSACNANARHPPSVVASDGKALGLLTVSASLKKRISARSVADWLARVCRH